MTVYFTYWDIFNPLYQRQIIFMFTVLHFSLRVGMTWSVSPSISLATFYTPVDKHVNFESFRVITFPARGQKVAILPRKLEMSSVTFITPRVAHTQPLLCPHTDVPDPSHASCEHNYSSHNSIHSLPPRRGCNRRVLCSFPFQFPAFSSLKKPTNMEHDLPSLLMYTGGIARAHPNTTSKSAKNIHNTTHHRYQEKV